MNPSLSKSAYAWMRDAMTPAQLREAGELVASLGLSAADKSRLGGYYQHFMRELSRPDAIERGLVQRIAQAGTDELATIWGDVQPSLKSLDAQARGRVWDEIEKRMPPKENRFRKRAA